MKMRTAATTTAHLMFFRSFHPSSTHKSQRTHVRKVGKYRPNANAPANITATFLSRGVADIFVEGGVWVVLLGEGGVCNFVFGGGQDYWILRAICMYASV